MPKQVIIFLYISIIIKLKKGPIFIYCGNEADITSFYNNSGFLTETLYE